MFEFFTDPILRGAMWGSLFMCVASALTGVLVFLRKRSLLSETLSHAAYPGASLGIAIFALLFPSYDEWSFLAVIFGAAFSAWLGLKAVNSLEKRMRVDTALCFVLSVFLGLGILIASAMQIHLPVWHKQVQMLLLGQAATMGDLHIWIYGGIAGLVALFLFVCYRPVQASLFDPQFAKVAKLPKVEKAIFWLLLLSLIVGIRCCGVVLMSAMAIAPAVAAKGLSNRLSVMLIMAALFGALSAILGNIFSYHYNLPTGPAIVLVSSSFAILSLVFRLSFRVIRIARYRVRCMEENALKAMWKKGTLPESVSRLIVFRLKRAGWIENQRLTADGLVKASSIVRLHRLWELYLTEALGMSSNKVHASAEEMEHILTPEMEARLTRLLEHPKVDPHNQPIPEKR